MLKQAYYRDIYQLWFFLKNSLLFTRVVLDSSADLGFEYDESVLVNLD